VLELAAPGAARRKVEAKFPTAALATLAHEGAWDALAAGGAELVGYVRPRDLSA
jgi:phosphohistidine phosphatase